MVSIQKKIVARLVKTWATCQVRQKLCHATKLCDKVAQLCCVSDIWA